MKPLDSRAKAADSKRVGLGKTQGAALLGMAKSLRSCIRRGSWKRGAD